MSRRRRTSCRSPITCRYLNYRLPSGRYVLLPLIQVELLSDKARFTTVALFDSGATDTFIPYELADILDILPKNPRSINVETAGGSVGFFGVKLKRLSLLKGGKVFYEFPNIRVLVPSEMSRDLPYVILGRNSVFKRFYVTFKENIKKFVIHHHKWAKKES